MISKSVKAKRRKYKKFYSVLNAVRMIYINGHWEAKISPDLKNKPQVCDLIERYNADFLSRTEVEAYKGVVRRLHSLKKVEYNIQSDLYLYTCRMNQGIPLNLFKVYT